MVTFHKVVGSVPATPDPDAIYFVRVGQGFDVWVTDSEGVPVRQNSNATPAPTIAFATLPSLLGSTALGGTLTVSLGTAEGTPEPTIAGSILRAGDDPVFVTDGQLITVEQDDLGNAIVLTAVASNTEVPNGIQEAVTVQIPAIAPFQFGVNDWSVTTGLEPLQIVLNVSALPFNGGSAITELQYNIGTGWTALDGIETGPRVLDMQEAGTQFEFSLRAVNQIGEGQSAVVKSANSGGELPNGSLWLGAYDSTSIDVTVSMVSNTDQIRLAAVPVNGGAEVVSPVLNVDPTYRFVRHSLTGLQSGVPYLIEQRNTQNQPATERGRFKTRPVTREAFKVGFASCYWAGQANNHPIFDTIIDENAGMEAFYNLGDRGYADISTNNVALYHAADNAAMSLSRAARLHRSMPHMYMWDDHDFGPNDSNAGSASRPAAVAWFRNRVPMRPVLTGPTDAPYYAHSPMPGVTVAMLDTRSERIVGSAQMIGAGQEAWLIGIIEALPLGDVLVINASVPWIATATGDTWSIASAQRQRIADAVAANCPGQVLIIAGDMHALAYDDGTNSVGGIPVAQAAPLGNSTSSKGGPYTVAPIQATQHQYGTLLFTPTTDGWSVRFEGWSVDDAGVQTRRIDQTATLEPIAIEPPSGDGPVLVQTALSPQGSTGQVTSVTVTYAQPTEGNLLVAMFGGQSTSLVIPDIAGWNVASYHTGIGFRHKAYWKFAEANEPTSITQSISSGSPRAISGQVMEFGNVADAYNLLIDTDGSLTATTGLDLGPHAALQSAISVAFMVYDIAGASETSSTGPGTDFTSALNARSNANQRFGAKIHSVAESVAASFTLAASVRSGRTLITFNPVV